MLNSAGEQIGIMLARDALKLAYEQGLDLVEIAPGAKPSVCRIMDYGKYKYEQSKREREARKKQKIVNVKEMKMRLTIERHDFEVKLRSVQRFLREGDKVKVTIMFRGREITHTNLGREMLGRLAAELSDLAMVERQPKIEGRNMTMILSPKQS